MGMRALRKKIFPIIFSIILLSSTPIAYALFLTPVEIIDSTGDVGGNALSRTEGVATDSSGNVFVAGATSNNVFKITPGGTITEIIDSIGDGVSPLNSAHAVATDLSGNVFVAGKTSGNIFKISTPGTCSTGGTLCTITKIIGNITPHGLATDSSGNLIFISGKLGNTVSKITPGGTLTTIIDSSGDGTNTLNFPHGLAIDSNDNVFVTGVNSDNIFKILTPGTCSTGGTLCTITQIIDSTGDGTNTLDDPRNIITDSLGNVFVVGKNTDNAFKITTPGTCSTGGTLCTITQIIDSTGDGTNTLVEPQAVATDSSGNVFVIGDITHNGLKIRTPGTCSTGGTPCTITQIIDSTGDGGANTLNEPFDVATDLSGNVFVTGRVSDNAFKIQFTTLVGGTIIPLDTTSLLLVGAQSTAAWMIPVLVAGAGIVLVFVRNPENS